QGLRQQRLARAGGSDEQDVALLELHVGLLAPEADALVMVVDRDGQRPLGVLLADDVTVELFDNRPRWRVLRPLGRLLFREDVVAESHALIADEDPRTGDQLSHLAPLLSAEGAVELFHPGPILTCSGALAIDWNDAFG